MTYQKISTITQDAIYNLIPIFEESTVRYLVESFGISFQELADTLHDVYDSQFIDRATGISLNNISKEVGIPRPITGEAATDDNKYRALIKAKIAANRSNGTIKDLYNILGLLGATSINISDIPYAAIRINIKGQFLLTLEEMLNILVGATPPISIEINKLSSTPFGFKNNPNAFGFGVGKLGRSKQI